jgi:hypothetical protein
MRQFLNDGKITTSLLSWECVDQEAAIIATILKTFDTITVM